MFGRYLGAESSAGGVDSSTKENVSAAEIREMSLSTLVQLTFGLCRCAGSNLISSRIVLLIVTFCRSLSECASAFSVELLKSIA